MIDELRWDSSAILTLWVNPHLGAPQAPRGAIVDPDRTERPLAVFGDCPLATLFVAVDASSQVNDSSRTSLTVEMRR